MALSVNFKAAEPLVELWCAITVVDQLKEDHPYLSEYTDLLSEHLKKAEAAFCEALNASCKSGLKDSKSCEES